MERLTKDNGKAFDNPELLEGSHDERDIAINEWNQRVGNTP